MSTAAFHVFSPNKLQSAVVFSSPHSGAEYTQSFISQSILSAHQIRSSEDAFIDQLFASAPEFGAPLLAAVAPRAFLDLNRAHDELDPALISGVPRKGQNPRIASGLGVIPRVVAQGQPIYHGKLSMAEAQNRIDRYWTPYHSELQRLLRQAHRQFGHAILVDCHSMPHEATEIVGKRGGHLADVVLGDRFGTSASSEMVDQVEAAFVAAGLKVSRNTPFAGAYVAQTYGRPSRGQHAVQVEIDRSLYMDEVAIKPNNNFAAFQDLIRGVIIEISKIGSKQTSLAAE